MPLETSGTLSIGGTTTNRSINLELGRSATATSSLGETDLRDLAGVASGTISISNFYGASSGFNVENSIKVQANSSNEWFYRSSPTAGNKRTFTFSFWFKRTQLTGFEADPYLMSQGTNARFHFAGDTLRFMFDGNSTEMEAAGKLRDTSAWYHIVLAVDTTQATNTNRVKMYVNGEDYPFNNNDWPSQNQESSWMSGTNMYFNTRDGDGSYDNSGYWAEVAVIDGSALTPTSFGEYDDSGTWKPKDLSGLSFGNQGFYLKFDNAASLGADSSGNGKNVTLNNITSVDQATDTPTNNGCTLNVLASLEGSNDITEGALVSTGKAGGGGNFNGTYGTIGIDPFNSTVDWYWEIEASSTTNGSSDDIGIGWIKESRITSGSTAYNNVYADGISRYSSQTATVAGDIWGVLLETGATPVFKLYRNDGLIHTSTHGSGGVSFDTLMFPYITVKGTGTDARLNFLNPASSFSIASGNTDPNGYGNFEFDTKGGYALCTKNLAEYG